MTIPEAIRVVQEHREQVKAQRPWPTDLGPSARLCAAYAVLAEAYITTMEATNE